MEPVDQKLLVRYRHMYIREIDLLSHQTRAVVYPSKKRSESKHRPDGKLRLAFTMRYGRAKWRAH